MSYSDPIVRTPIVALANASVSSAADVAQVASPRPGMKGRVVGVSLVTKVATTVAASQLLLGTQADPDAYGTIDVPVTAIDTQISLTEAQIDAFSDLPADTVITLSGDGAATAGSLDIFMDIVWF